MTVSHEEVHPPPAPGPTAAVSFFADLNAPDVADQVNRPPATTAGVMTTLPLDELRESPLNPRKTFGAMASLTDSVKRIGLVQPLVVRALDPRTRAAGGGSFEIVCGHRRYRAAREAGLTEVPAKVVDLDDVQALEAMLTENGQREDLTEIEQAETYAALRLRGWKVEQIAARLSTTVGTIYHRLKLLDLIPEARQALADRVLPSSVAVPLARLPSGKAQAKALDKILATLRDDAGTVRARDAIAWLQHEFTRPLKLAPFSLTDDSLNPPATACSVCPKNTRSATPGLFDDLRETKAPICTDTVCFGEKAAASWKRKAAAAAKKGHQVLTPAEGARLFAHDNALPYGSRYVEAGQVNHADPKKRTWRELVERAPEELQPTLVYAPDRDLVGHDLYERAAAVKACAASGAKWALAETKTASPSEPEPKRSPAEREAEAKAQDRRIDVIDQTLSAIGAAVAKKGITAAGWRALALAVATRFVSPDVLDLFDVDEKKLREAVTKPDPTVAIRFLFVSLLRDSDLADGDGEPVPTALATFAKAHGVNPADVAKAYDAEQVFAKKGRKS